MKNSKICQKWNSICVDVHHIKTIQICKSKEFCGYQDQDIEIVYKRVKG